MEWFIGALILIMMITLAILIPILLIKLLIALAPLIIIGYVVYIIWFKKKVKTTVYETKVHMDEDVIDVSFTTHDSNEE